MPIRDFRDLEVYQESKQLVYQVDSLAKLIPNAYRELSRNLIKTVCQIGPAIAEGYGKKSSSIEFKRFLTIAMGTVDELIAHLEQIEILCPSIGQLPVKQVIANCESLVKRLQALKSRWH